MATDKKWIKVTGPLSGLWGLAHHIGEVVELDSDQADEIVDSRHGEHTEAPKKVKPAKGGSGDLSGLQSDIDKLTAEKSLALKDVETLKADVQKLTEENTSLKEENTTFKGENETLKAELLKLRPAEEEPKSNHADR